MVKRTGIGLCAFLIIFLASYADSGSKILQEKEVKQKIEQLKEKIQELAVKIERNPEAEEVDKWRSEHRKYINELEKLLAESKADVQKEEYTDLELAVKQSREKLHELESAIENMKKKGESKEKIKVYQDRMAEEEQRLEKLIHALELRRTGQQTEGTERERQIQRLKEEIQELRAGIERNPDTDNAVKWRGMLKERLQELERIQRGGEIETPVDLPMAYQRERGELTAYVISSTENDVTVRVRDSNRVMVLRVRKWRRVEGQRVENREEMDFVNSLKKGELIWVNYIEGEERGSFFILEIKRIDK